ncbi:solute carrier family 2, facilitated glucose transporter member 5-like [Elgaria multicarinata webbii]|uniref:solute carrier family 2, facilitated glucose transporter member 5-like n=1 Tax=Elgaria multicarinata webbii TaxID=159646 RepID=UPI002FCCE534
MGSNVKKAKAGKRDALSIETYPKSMGSVENPDIERTKPSRWALIRPLVMVTLTISFGSSLQYGYNLWVVNHPAALIQDFYNETYRQRKKVFIQANFLNFLYNLTVTIFSLGGLIGSLLVCPIVDKCGRRGALMLNNCLSIIASILMGFTSLVHAYEYTIFSRLVTGICSGIFSCVVPMYLAEMAPKKVRGTIMSVSMLFVAIGVLTSQVLGLPEHLGTKKDWPILLSLTGFLAMSQIIILPAFPESPRYLLIQRRDEEKARQALKKLRCQENVDREIEELYQENLMERTERAMNGFQLLFYRGLRWQIISVIVLMGGQQLTGINAAYYYAERIYAGMYLNRQETRYITMASSICSILTLMVVVYAIDIVGRRVLILTGFGLCSLLCVLLTLTLELQITIPWMSYISSSLLFVFLIGHATGPGPIPNVIIAELFLQSSRSTGFVLGGLVHWLLNFVMGVLFLQIETRIGSYSFLLFWPLCVGTFIFILKVIPETMNRNFLEIRRLMSAQQARRIQVQATDVKRNTRRRSTQHGKRKRRKSSAR